MLIFRITDPKPAAAKRSPQSAASRGHIGRSAMAITVHDLLMVTDDGAIVSVSPAIRDGSCVMTLNDLAALSIETLQTGLLKLEALAAHSYMLADSLCGIDGMSAVTMLVQSRAFPGSASMLDLDTVGAADGSVAITAALEQMVQEGLVERVDRYGRRGFCLTDSAKCRLVCGVHLRESGPAITNREDLALRDKSDWELCQQLESDGWTWRPLPRRAAQRQSLTYTAGAEKCWYSQSIRVNRLYMLCLLESDLLFANTDVTEIPHWHSSPTKAYSRILQGKALDVPRLALALDVQSDDNDEGGRQRRHRGPARRALAGGGAAPLAVLDLRHGESDSGPEEVLQYHLSGSESGREHAESEPPESEQSGMASGRGTPAPDSSPRTPVHEPDGPPAAEAPDLELEPGAPDEEPVDAPDEEPPPLAPPSPAEAPYLEDLELEPGALGDLPPPPPPPPCPADPFGGDAFAVHKQSWAPFTISFKKPSAENHVARRRCLAHTTGRMMFRGARGRSASEWIAPYTG